MKQILPQDLYWKFIPKSGIRNNTHPFTLGTRIQAKTAFGNTVEKPKMCLTGFHASKTLEDVLKHSYVLTDDRDRDFINFKDDFLCLVKLEGNKHSGHHTDKIAAQFMTIVAKVPIKHLKYLSLFTKDRKGKKRNIVWCFSLNSQSTKSLRRLETLLLHSIEMA